MIFDDMHVDKWFIYRKSNSMIYFTSRMTRLVSYMASEIMYSRRKLNTFNLIKARTATHLAIKENPLIQELMAEFPHAKIVEIDNRKYLQFSDNDMIVMRLKYWID